MGLLADDKMSLSEAASRFRFCMLWTARQYWLSRAAIYWTRSSNAASISDIEAAEGSTGCEPCCKSRLNVIASSTIAGSVAGSSDLKPGGTLELLIRSESGSRHLAEYGSPKKSSNERRVNSGFSSKAV